MILPLKQQFIVQNAHVARENFEYYISIVPTIYVDKLGSLFSRYILTNQYAVTEFKHEIGDDVIDASEGIYFNYDIDALSVRVTAQRMSFTKFITRLCGIFGGIYVVLGLLLKLYHSMTRYIKLF